MEIGLKYQGGGKFICSNMNDAAYVERELSEGEYRKAKLTRSRSLPQHNLFWAVMDKAFMNQNPKPPLQPFTSKERMRYYILVKAGHCTEMFFDDGAITKEVVDALATFHPDLFFFKLPHGIRCKKAKSISFGKCDQQDFVGIMINVLDVVCTEIVPGVSVELLVNEVKDVVSDAKYADQLLNMTKQKEMMVA